ncbi:hypothetical protein ACE6H2_008123 [Prunus campanulata]
MEFVQRDQKGYSDKEDQDQEDQEEEDIISSKFSSSSHNYNYSNYGSSPKYKATFVPPPPPPLPHHHEYQQRKPWAVHNHGSPEAINFMDLSLNHEQAAADGANNNNNWPPNSEREHMFDKVVTPSDVGKLNRLVIPKQHAERYFPLDSTANDKGLLLNFQDRTGKPWRFRYSYWNSSQSYVMTKGWSRFVKEKKLDAGDVVSFERGVGDSGKDRLYIDWRRRPPPPPPPPHHQHHGQFGNCNDRYGGGGGRLYSLLQRPPPSMMSMPLRHHDHFHPSNNVHHPYHHHHHQIMNHQYLQHQIHHQLQVERDQVVHHHHQYPMVIDSVPFVQHGKMSSSGASAGASTGKRLRLFGVNMECSPNIEEDQTDEHQYQILPSTAIPYNHLPSSSLSAPLELRLPNAIGANQIPLPNTGAADQYLSKKGKSTSLSFYLDP